MAICKRCGKEIKFIKTKKGKWLPVEQEIYEEANKRHVRLINGDEFKKCWKTSVLNTISEGLNGDNSYGDESKRLY